MRHVTLQLFNEGKWWDAARLSFTDDALSSRCTLAYKQTYIVDVKTYDARDAWACSVNAPISAFPTEYNSWPALLDDILPVGQSRDWWLRYLNMSTEDVFTQNYALLTHACMSPIGNLRIKESLQATQKKVPRRFHIDDVVSLQYDFLEYANENGAAVGGATGAGGIAPKLLLMVDDDKVYIDGDFAGKPIIGSPYLTKFARNKRTSRDNNILKAEGIYYQALTQILKDTDIETIDVTKLKILEDNNGQVSLWLPRFDVGEENNVATRYGLESIYSIINAEPGSFQDHFSVIEKVWQRISPVTKMSKSDFVTQYVARDFLNLIFGNSDNHGRNISFLKYQDDLTFAPIYDFAPMKADPEMITRLFKWGRNCESGGMVNFRLVIEALSEFCDTQAVSALLRSLAQKLLHLRELLSDLACPEEILHFPAIGFAHIEHKLKQMEVYDE